MCGRRGEGVWANATLIACFKTCDNDIHRDLIWVKLPCMSSHILCECSWSVGKQQVVDAV